MIAASSARSTATASGRVHKETRSRNCIAELALLWQILAIDWRNWIPESDFQ